MSFTQRERIGYALAKQVPAMRIEVTLHTSYGELALFGKDAARVAAVVEKILQAKYRRLEIAERKAAT
jgi:hypothetical protein